MKHKPPLVGIIKGLDRHSRRQVEFDDVECASGYIDAQTKGLEEVIRLGFFKSGKVIDVIETEPTKHGFYIREVGVPGLSPHSSLAPGPHTTA